MSPAVRTQQIKDRTMNFGIIEIAVIAVSWSFFALIHFVVARQIRKDNQKAPPKLLLMYGIPTCYTIGCLLTPPDLISSLTIAIPSVVLYAVICGCALLVMRSLSKA